MWKAVRVSLLLIVLAFVASELYFEQHRAHEWRYAQDIAIVPVAGDDSPVTAAYLAALDPSEFSALESFMADQASSYGLALKDPVRVHLYAPAAHAPPAPPPPGHAVAAVWWSLSLRFYAMRNGAAPKGASTVVRMFVVYHDPARAPQLAHSSALAKGLIGVAHVFAARHMRGSNAVVLAHEYLHTLGATDKYDPETDAPLYPAGFAEPAREPRYPQRFAEIMAGRRPLSPSTQEMPESLDQCVIGAATASEIQWTTHP